MNLAALIAALLLAMPAVQPPIVVYTASACSKVTVTYATADGSEQSSGGSTWFAVEPLRRGQFYDLSAQKSGGGSCPVVASIYTVSLPASVAPSKIGEYAEQHGDLRATSQSDAPFGVAGVHWTAGRELGR